MDEFLLLAKLNSPSLLAPLPVPVSLKHQLFLLIKYTSVFHACFLFTEELLLEKLKATSLYRLLISNMLPHSYYRLMSFNKEAHIQIIFFSLWKRCDFVDITSLSQNCRPFSRWDFWAFSLGFMKFLKVWLHFIFFYFKFLHFIQRFFFPHFLWRFPRSLSWCHTWTNNNSLLALFSS